MKKSFLLLVLALATFSCQQQQSNSGASELKTAYVDTSKLMEEYTHAKDIESKYKNKSEETGKELEAEIKKFQAEVQNFEKNAQDYGQQWAQKKGQELQKWEQELSYARQALIQNLQVDSSKEMDSLVSNVKKYIKNYGKEKGFDYIYGTGEAASILYAKDAYDITDELIKLLNDKYTNKEALSTNEATKDSVK
jgi:outer membrane protein